MSNSGFFPAGSVTMPLMEVVAPDPHETLHWVPEGHCAPTVPPLDVPPSSSPKRPPLLPPLPLPPLLLPFLSPLPFDPPQPDVEPKFRTRAPPSRTEANMDRGRIGSSGFVDAGHILTRAFPAHKEAPGVSGAVATVRMNKCVQGEHAVGQRSTLLRAPRRMASAAQLRRGPLAEVSQLPLVAGLGGPPKMLATRRF